MQQESKQKRNNKFILPILSLIFSGLIFILGFVLGRLGFNVVWEGGDVSYDIKGTLYPEEEDIDFDLFWEVWNKLEEMYVDRSLDEQDMFYGAIKGLVSSLDDPATKFYTPEETEEYEEEKSGKFEGIGIEMGYSNNRVIIKKIFMNTPADESELLEGDIIYKVDETDVSESDVYEIAKLIRGEKGTEVVLTVQRSEDEEKEISIVRDEVYVGSIDWEIRDDGIAIITVRRFTENTFSDFVYLWETVINKVYQSNPTGLIIDLRGNGGGYLDGAVYLAGEFLEENSVVLYIQNREGVQQTEKVTRDGRFLDIPLVLLVDNGTASSSEIFAGALQYYDRADVIGEKTYGKGTAQDVLKPSDWGGASIHITTQKWLLPDKRWINSDNSIDPDIKVEISLEQIKKGEDPQLNRAIEELSK